MALFIHLTPEKNLRNILRNGIKVRSKFSRGIFAMPVLQNYFVSHQWLRELRNWGQKNFVAIYFRIPDDEEVTIGRYNGEHFQMTASEATGKLFEAQYNCSTELPKQPKRRKKPKFVQPTSPLGYEIIIHRAISPKEIIRIKSVSQVLGWRYSPEAHGKPPVVCLCCERGRYGIRKLEKQVIKAEQKGKETKIIMFGRD